MKKCILAASLLLVAALVSSANPNPKKSSGTIVLVHGAWSEAAAWDCIVPLLQEKGFEVISVNLPGHGKDNRPISGITFNDYVETTKNAIGSRNNVILVGHSMGGLVVSQVAEQIPGQIKRLIYLAAFLPRDGESLFSLAQEDAESHFGKYLSIDKNGNAAVFNKEGVKDVFGADASAPLIAQIQATLKQEPLAPLASPVTLTQANFGRIEKVYVYTVNDHAISYAFQQKMVKRSTIVRAYALPSSHIPFVVMPGILAAIFAQELDYAG